jgi:predicted ATPase
VGERHAASSVLIEEIALRGFLSFAPDAAPVQLRSLNVLIGPNGSGKSNLLDAVGVMQAAPSEIASPIHRGGGIDAWLWKDQLGVRERSLSIDAVLRMGKRVRYHVALATDDGHFVTVSDERIESASATVGAKKPYSYFGYENGKPVLNRKREKGRLVLRPSQIDRQRSILAQRREPDIYPELSQLAERLGAIRGYRSWSFGRDAPGRRVQPTDLPVNALSSSGDNLVLVLSRLAGIPSVKREILERLRQLYAPLDDLHVEITAGSAQLFLHEGDRIVPATRLSDGTLRYLSLLTILCDPEPAPLVLIEEPELGLHPDVLPTVADLLVQAAERTQLIVTTHSDVLVDCFTESPEHVLVCERDEGGTHLRRLDAERLAGWLKDYSLGTLWSRGDIGGNRW